jgi:RNA polymerase sigma-70 factor, ECF subfamily
MNGMHPHISSDFATQRRQVLCDEQLVSAARNGSPAAFAELQRIYSRPIFRTIMGITKNNEDAEDALQDTFLRAYASLQSFEGRSSFYSWLTRIAINSALMLLRKRRTRAEVSVEISPDGEESSTYEIRDPGLNPEQICDQQQRHMYMMRAIKRLEPTLRTALLMAAHDCSLKEIARTLKISEAAVKARLYRARQRLIATGCRNRGRKRGVVPRAA